MERVVSLLCDIETQANVIISRANDQKLELAKKYDEDISNLDKSLDDSVTSKLKEIEVNYNLELEAEKSKLMKDCDSSIATMQSKYDENHDSIIQDIISKITM